MDFVQVVGKQMATLVAKGEPSQLHASFSDQLGQQDTAMGSSRFAHAPSLPPESLLLSFRSAFGLRKCDVHELGKKEQRWMAGGLSV